MLGDFSTVGGRQRDLFNRFGLGRVTFSRAGRLTNRLLAAADDRDRYCRRGLWITGR